MQITLVYYCDPEKEQTRPLIKKVNLPCLPPPGSSIFMEGATIGLLVYGNPSFNFDEEGVEVEVKVRAYLKGDEVDLMEGLVNDGWVEISDRSTKSRKVIQ